MPGVGSARLQTIYRYPVKGLTPEPLDSVILTPGQTLPFDRAYAVENGPSLFDPANPKYLQKIHFVMLMRNEALAALRSKFDDPTHTLVISKDGSEIARGDLRSEAGRAAIEDVVSNVVTAGLRGRPKIVASPGHSFSDVAAKCVHIVNRESVRALQTAMGVAIDPRRFRPNLLVDGWPAWSELGLVGKTIMAGPAKLEIFKRTERCAATNVDPETGMRDLKIPSFLSKTYGHTDFGVYARVISGGTLSPGDTLEIVN
jgi:uncharacterized protein YcbX